MQARSLISLLVLLTSGLFNAALADPARDHRRENIGPGMSDNTDRAGSDITGFQMSSRRPAECQEACRRKLECKAWTYVRPGVQGVNPVCYLKNAVPRATANNCCISGENDTIVRDHRDVGRVVKVQGCGLGWLDAYEDARFDFGAVHWRPQEDATQQWVMIPDSSGAFRFKQESSGRYLDAHENQQMGFRVVTRPYQEDGTQLWRVETIGGASRIRHATNGRYLTCSPRSPYLFTAYWQTGLNYQEWFIR